MVGVVHLTRPIDINELSDKYRNEKDPRVKERLLALIHLYEGKTVKEVSTIVKRSIRTVERWVSAWNKSGYEGLAPQFTGGPKPKLSVDEWDKIVKEIKEKGMTIKDVTVYVNDTRGVHYGYKGVWEVLRRKRHVPYGKAYKMNEKRPSNAEETLKKGSRNRFRGPSSSQTTPQL